MVSATGKNSRQGKGDRERGACQLAVSGAAMGRSPEKVSSEQRLEEVRCTQVLFMEKGSDGGGSLGEGWGQKRIIWFRHVASRCLVDVRKGGVLRGIEFVGLELTRHVWPGENGWRFG